MSELVMCFESTLIRGVLSGQGFNECADLEPLTILRPWFAPRASVEEWEVFRQVIPYIVLLKGDAVCVYRRTRKGNESRLHERWSVGFGGHIHLADIVSREDTVDIAGTIRTAADREVREEFGAVSILERRVLGLIVDDEEPVGRVHIGVVELWRVKEAEWSQNEDKQDGVKFVDETQITKMWSMLERWSQLCAKAVLKHLKEMNKPA